MNSQTKANENSIAKEAVAIIKKCKSCGSKNLFQIDYDFYCTDCDWNSIAIDVNSGKFAKRNGLGGEFAFPCKATSDRAQITESDVA